MQPYKESSTDTYDNMDKSWEYQGKWKNLVTKMMYNPIHMKYSELKNL